MGVESGGEGSALKSVFTGPPRNLDNYGKRLVIVLPGKIWKIFLGLLVWKRKKKISRLEMHFDNVLLC